jgi:curved DNA-binding protein CbpA
MTDCYRTLGVSQRASAHEIRSAFLAKMKALHPDACRAAGSVEGDAGEISYAYWQLRDPGRRAEHDRLHFEKSAVMPLAPPKSGSTRKHKKLAQARPPALSKTPSNGGDGSRRPSRSKRLQPLRAVTGLAACLVAAAGFWIAFNHLDRQAGAQARTASVLDATAKGETAQLRRRGLDRALVTAAAQSFRNTMRRAGLAGAHDYARQCMLELAARPTMSMLDYCIAFDDRAADWEGAQDRRAREALGRPYFTQGQRFGRYRRVAQTLKSGPVRDAMLAEVAFFAAVDR